ncbi:unnamed protein product, partial [Coregonus sp. 'balchen']
VISSNRSHIVKLPATRWFSHRELALHFEERFGGCIQHKTSVNKERTAAPVFAKSEPEVHSLIYEDGQVGDTSINTQDAGIHREILRVIGNQTATG